MGEPNNIGRCDEDDLGFMCKLSFFMYFFVVKMILDLCVNYHREIIPNSSLVAR
jgi:hypothetical protein